MATYWVFVVDDLHEVVYLDLVQVSLVHLDCDSLDNLDLALYPYCDWLGSLDPLSSLNPLVFAVGFGAVYVDQ